MNAQQKGCVALLMLASMLAAARTPAALPEDFRQAMAGVWPTAPATGTSRYAAPEAVRAWAAAGFEATARGVLAWLVGEAGPMGEPLSARLGAAPLATWEMGLRPPSLAAAAAVARELAPDLAQQVATRLDELGLGTGAGAVWKVLERLRPRLVVALLPARSDGAWPVPRPVLLVWAGEPSAGGEALGRLLGKVGAVSDLREAVQAQ